jgi:hypothetical protein
MSWIKKWSDCDYDKRNISVVVICSIRYSKFNLICSILYSKFNVICSILYSKFNVICSILYSKFNVICSILYSKFNVICVITIRPFLYSRHITVFVTRVIRQVYILSRNCSPPGACEFTPGVPDIWSLVFCVMFCRSLFGPLSCFPWSLQYNDQGKQKP